MMDLTLVRSIGVLTWAAGTLALLAAQPLAGWATMVIITFLVVCPGLAIVWLVGVRGIIVQATLAVALSLALVVLMAELLVYSGNWSGRTGALLLANLTIGVALLTIYVQHRHRPAAPDATWQ